MAKKRKIKRSRRRAKVKRVLHPSLPKDDTPDQAPKDSLPQLLMKLSTELRLMIFEYLVLRKKTVRICTVLKKDCRSNSFRFKNTCSLRLVNRQIYSEVNRLFYAYNCIVIGNGSWKKLGYVNLYALQRFVACVPGIHISEIRELRLELGVTNISPSTHQEEYTTQGHPDDLINLARTVNGYFTGVTKLNLCIPRIAEFSAGSRPYLCEVIVTNGAAFACTRKRAEFLRRLTGEEKWPEFINSLLKLERLEFIDAGILKAQFRDNLQRFVRKSDAAGRVTVLHSLIMRKRFIL